MKLRRRKRETPASPELREPERRLVVVVVDGAYAAAVRNHLGPMVLVSSPVPGRDAVALTMEFDATSDEIAERMGRRAVERVGVEVVSSSVKRGELRPIGTRL